jgi:calcium-dependent protein kinase
MILDKNGDGKLSREEITQGIEKIKCTSFFDIEKIIEECDADGSDFIDYSEFLTAAMDWRSNLCKKKLETAFKTFDLNGDGKIDLSELKEIIGGKLTEQEYKEILKQADLNGDGVVDYKEFEEICMKFIT